MLNEVNQTHNFISSSGSGTVIIYDSGSDFLTSYGSGSTKQKVTFLRFRFHNTGFFLPFLQDDGRIRIRTNND
jgi:hypothetical protein